MEVQEESLLNQTTMAESLPQQNTSNCFFYAHSFFMYFYGVSKKLEKYVLHSGLKNWETYFYLHNPQYIYESSFKYIIDLHKL